MPSVILHVVCAWCDRVLVAGTPGAAVSHGMCPACIVRMDAEIEAPPPAA